MIELTPAAPTASVRVWDVGTASLNWSITNKPAWLTITPASGTITDQDSTATLSLAAASGTAAGTYEGAVTVSGNGRTHQLTVRLQQGIGGTGGGTQPPASSLSNFTLVNTSTQQPVSGFAPLPAGAVIDLAQLGAALGLRVNPAAGSTVGSVRFDVDGQTGVQVEGAAPYSLDGDNNGALNPWTLGPGTHTVTATPFSGAGATGTAGTAISITFTIQGATTPPTTGLASFTLVNTSTQQPVAGFNPLPAGANIITSQLGNALGLRVNPAAGATVGSVRFDVDGQTGVQVESIAPYSLHGDINGALNPWTLGPGTHTVTATPFSGAGATGTAGTAISVTFTLQAGGFALWRGDHQIPETVPAEDDADGDGLPLLLEFALGTSPASADSAARPLVVVGPDGRLRLTFFRARDELDYVVEASPDLLAWSPLATNPGAVGENVTVADSSDSSPRRFLRLRVTAP